MSKENNVLDYFDDLLT